MPESQLEVLIAIASIGPEAADVATKPLLNLTRNAQGRPKRGAIYALAKIGAKEAIPLFQEDNPDVQSALRKARSDKEESVRQAAEKALTGVNSTRPGDGVPEVEVAGRSSAQALGGFLFGLVRFRRIQFAEFMWHVPEALEKWPVVFFGMDDR